MTRMTIRRGELTMKDTEAFRQAESSISEETGTVVCSGLDMLV